MQVHSFLCRDNKSTLMSNSDNMRAMGKFDFETLEGRVQYAISLTGKRPTQLSGIIGVSPSAIYQWRDGLVNNIKATNLFPLARESGLSAEWILEGKGPIKPEVAEKDAVDLSRLSDIIVTVETFLQKSHLDVTAEDKAILIQHIISELGDLPLSDDVLSATIKALRYSK